MLNTCGEEYARVRPPYPESLFTFLIGQLGLQGNDRIVDVGCGTGRLTLPLAEMGLNIVGLEPWHEMLDAARARSSRKRIYSNIQWALSPAEGLLSVIHEQVRAVLFANSFHCCRDRRHVLCLCDQVVAPDGGVAVIRSGWFAEPPHWFTILNETAREFATRMHDDYRQPPVDKSGGADEELLRASPFSHLTTWLTEIVHVRTLQEVVAFTYSMAVYPMAAFDRRLEAFEMTLKQRLLSAYPFGEFEERCFLRAIVGHREAFVE
jgi:SAM-dependent methyltransferase